MARAPHGSYLKRRFAISKTIVTPQVYRNVETAQLLRERVVVICADATSLMANMRHCEGSTNGTFSSYILLTINNLDFEKKNLFLILGELVDSSLKKTVSNS